jgi:ABC-type nitrate/sulfonate/bicarbonate transport system substrate-binding protein
LVASDITIKENPNEAAAAVRALVRVQQTLRKNPARAREVGILRFPSAEAELITELIERDLPYYDPFISETAVSQMNRFAGNIGLLSQPVSYEQVVATQFQELWAV